MGSDDGYLTLPNITRYLRNMIVQSDNYISITYVQI